MNVPMLSLSVQLYCM